MHTILVVFCHSFFVCFLILFWFISVRLIEAEVLNYIKQSGSVPKWSQHKKDPVKKASIKTKNQGVCKMVI